MFNADLVITISTRTCLRMCLTLSPNYMRALQGTILYVESFIQAVDMSLHTGFLTCTISYKKKNLLTGHDGAVVVCVAPQKIF